MEHHKCTLLGTEINKTSIDIRIDDCNYLKEGAIVNNLCPAFNRGKSFSERNVVIYL